MLRNGEWRATVVAVALVAAAGLASCGADETSVTDSASSEGPSSSSPSQKPASAKEAVPPGTPSCSEIWQDGGTLPRGYAGCADGDTFVKRDVIGCSSGQRLATHADRFYGVLGGTVHETRRPLEQDREYVATTRRCRA